MFIETVCFYQHTKDTHPLALNLNHVYDFRPGEMRLNGAARNITIVTRKDVVGNLELDEPYPEFLARVQEMTQC